MYCMNNVHILSFTCVCTVWTGKLILISYSSPLATAATFYNVNTIAWAAAIIITWPESHKAPGHNRVCNGHNWWVWGIMQKMWLHIHQVWAVLLIKTSQDLHVHLVSVLLLCTNQCWLPWEQGSMYIRILHNRLVLHSYSTLQHMYSRLTEHTPTTWRYACTKPDMGWRIRRKPTLYICRANQLFTDIHCTVK